MLQCDVQNYAYLEIDLTFKLFIYNIQTELRPNSLLRSALT